VLWDLVQRAQIRSMRAGQEMAAREALLRDQRAERDVEDLEDRLRDLGTVVEALWTLCRDRLGLTDDELADGIAATIERRRAEAEAGPIRCGACQAAISPDRARCQFCGAASPRPPSPF
jgi:hypothetical protein